MDDDYYDHGDSSSHMDLIMMPSFHHTDYDSSDSDPYDRVWLSHKSR